MDILEERYCDKSTWGHGPWQDEPDKIQWKDEATGLDCLAVRNETGGHWCGYVGVTKDHPWHGKDYSDDAIDVDCHGGLTYSDACHGRVCHVTEDGDHAWWFGFDCAHGCDFSPRSEAVMRGLGLEFGHSPMTSYKSLAYVRRECRYLAKQVKSLGVVDAAETE